jgi:hypothetical protein
LFTHRFRYGGGTILNESGAWWHLPSCPSFRHTILIQSGWDC